MAAGTEMGTEMEKKTMEKRTAEMEESVGRTQKTMAVNEKMEWESLYQNCHNTCQTDGRIILYKLKKRKMN
jgi:hypothetical protein